MTKFPLKQGGKKHLYGLQCMVALRNGTPNNLKFALLRGSLLICQLVAGVSEFFASSQNNIKVP